MLPKVALGRHCCSQSTDIDNYRALVGDVDECAEMLGYLLDHPDVAREFGHAGREKIRRQFLLPRLVRDDLRLIQETLSR